MRTTGTSAATGRLQRVRRPVAAARERRRAFRRIRRSAAAPATGAATRGAPSEAWHGGRTVSAYGAGLVRGRARALIACPRGGRAPPSGESRAMQRNGQESARVQNMRLIMPRSDAVIDLSSSESTGRSATRSSRTLGSTRPFQVLDGGRCQPPETAAEPREHPGEWQELPDYPPRRIRFRPISEPLQLQRDGDPDVAFLLDLFEDLPPLGFRQQASERRVLP